MLRMRPRPRFIDPFPHPRAALTSLCLVAHVTAITAEASLAMPGFRAGEEGAMGADRTCGEPSTIARRDVLRLGAGVSLVAMLPVAARAATGEAAPLYK